MPTDNTKLLAVLPFATESYSALPLTSLTAYSTFWLSEWALQTSLENVAVLNFHLFPAKFAMVSWPQFPDVNRTNRSVLQMRPKYRNLATSVTEKGVFLNERGIEEAAALTRRLGNPRFSDGTTSTAPELIASARGTGRARTVHPEDVVRRVRSSRLFELYKQGQWESVEAIDLINFLEVYDHTPSKEKRRRLQELLSAARNLSDEEIVTFLKTTNERLGSYLAR